MITCEGCTLGGPKEIGIEAFRKAYPQCPGYPTESGCHGFYAGCDCADCLKRDREERGE